ncbi:MAG: hypothetical protein L0191_17440 [Acidobacteria bacterium]|nr:hypothetical protein [Acidobacteriota bacterium]MCI0569052.1 hypothetical protein [Acidobacteriota bacterium]
MDTLTIKPVHPKDVIRWIARIWSLASLGMLLFFLAGEEFHPERLTAPEWASLVFFPTGVTFGLVIAWRWEALGGAVTVTCLAAFYAVNGFLGHVLSLGWAFVVLVVPGFLFFLSATLRRRELE